MTAAMAVVVHDERRRNQARGGIPIGIRPDVSHYAHFVCDENAKFVCIQFFFSIQKRGNKFRVKLDTRNCLIWC